MTTKSCFVVSPIGDEGSATRKRSNGFLREVIRPVTKEYNYDIERADHDKAPGIVTEAIVRKILDADLVVADLHNKNPNVMYEVALRHATGKPIVQMIEQNEELPFDIGGLNTIFYDPTVDGLASWRDDLRMALEAVEKGKGGENPVSRAALFQGLQQRSGKEGEILTALLESIEQLRYEVHSTQRKGRATRSTQESRRLLPPDQYMEESLSHFLEHNPALLDRHFLLRVDGQTVMLSIAPPELSGPLETFEYEFEVPEDGVLKPEIERVKRDIFRDVLSTESLDPEDTEATDDD